MKLCSICCFFVGLPQPLQVNCKTKFIQTICGSAFVEGTFLWLQAIKSYSCAANALFFNAQISVHGLSASRAMRYLIIYGSRSNDSINIRIYSCLVRRQITRSQVQLWFYFSARLIHHICQKPAIVFMHVNTFCFVQMKLYCFFFAKKGTNNQLNWFDILS